MSKRKKSRTAAVGRTTDLTAAELDARFDAGAEDVLEHFDEKSAVKTFNLSLPVWMAKALDDEANRIGIARQALVKMWLDDKLSALKRERSA